MSLLGKTGTSQITRVSTVIWVLALPMILGFFALSNIQNDIDLKGLMWIGIGIFTVILSIFALLFIIAGADEDTIRTGQFAGIFIGGIIMMIAFLKTNALLVPIIIHWSFK